MVHPGLHLTGQRALLGRMECYSLTPASCIRATLQEEPWKCFGVKGFVSATPLIGQESAGYPGFMASMLDLC